MSLHRPFSHSRSSGCRAHIVQEKVCRLLLPHKRINVPKARGKKVGATFTRANRSTEPESAPQKGCVSRQGLKGPVFGLPVYCHHRIGPSAAFFPENIVFLCSRSYRFVGFRIDNGRHFRFLWKVGLRRCNRERGISRHQLWRVCWMVLQIVAVAT